MTETATQKRTQKTAQVPTVRELIAETLRSHEGFQAASEKLRDLQSTLAVHRAEFDQLSAEAKTGVSELADRILNGDDLADRDQVFAKRQALSQRIEAYQHAILKQEQFVEAQRAQASKLVEQAIAPLKDDRLARLRAAVQELEAAKEAIAEVSQQLAVSSVHHSFRFPTNQVLTIAINQIKVALDR